MVFIIWLVESLEFSGLSRWAQEVFDLLLEEILTNSLRRIPEQYKDIVGNESSLPCLTGGIATEILISLCLVHE